MLCFLGFIIFSSGIVDTISNPNTEGAYKIEFQEDLRFGGDLDAGDEYLWMDRGRPTTFEVGLNGHFFILDPSNSRILEFDEAGKFVVEFAKRGEGPGEFQNLNNFQILSDGSAIGMDALQGTRKASYFDKDLKFIESKNVGGLAVIPASPYFSPDGSLFFSALFSVKLNADGPPDINYLSAIMNGDFTPAREFGGNPWPRFDQAKINDKGYWADFIGEQFDILINKTTMAATFLSNGDVLIFDAKKYAIEKWSKDLKIHELTVTKEYTPVLFSEEERNALAESLEKTVFDQGLQNLVDETVLKKALEKANLPIRQNPVAGIVPMEQGQFFVVNRVNMRDGSISGDFFNSDGQFMGKLSIPGVGLYELNTSMNASMRVVFKNGMAYVMSRNEEGDNVLVRYKYKISLK